MMIGYRACVVRAAARVSSTRRETGFTPYLIIISCPSTSFRFVLVLASLPKKKKKKALPGTDFDFVSLLSYLLSFLLSFFLFFLSRWVILGAHQLYFEPHLLETSFFTSGSIISRRNKIQGPCFLFFFNFLINGAVSDFMILFLFILPFLLPGAS